jgi:hypothetical protein avisC_05128
VGKQLSITLPNRLADELEQRVAAGAYADRSEAVSDGLRELFAREEALDTWLRSEAAPAYDELRTDSALALDASQVRARIAALHNRRMAED